MIQTIKRYLFMASASLMLLIPAAAAGTVSAAVTVTGAAGCSGLSNSIAEGVNNSTPGGGNNVDCTDTTTNDTAVTNLAQRIVKTFSIIVGAASVIMIIYGGFR
jgi:hypothetical protein